MRNLRSLATRSGLILVAGLLALALAGQAAAGTLDEVKKRGKLIAGVKTDFPPFGYVDSAGKNLGFDVDVAHLFAKALFDDENKVELVAVTSGNRIPFLQSGKIDIIIFPQAIRRMLPPFVGLCTILIKDTSLAAIIGVFELTRAAQETIERTFRSFEIYILAAAIYFCLSYPLSLLAQHAEARLHRS